jgi:hypothetical protein
VSILAVPIAFLTRSANCSARRPVGDGQDEHQLVAAMSGPVSASVEARRCKDAFAGQSTVAR